MERKSCIAVLALVDQSIDKLRSFLVGGLGLGD